MHFYHTYDATTGRPKACLIDSAKKKIDFLTGSLPGAILIPAESHLITVINKQDYAEPAISGIDSLTIGNELLIAAQTNENESSKSEKKLLLLRILSTISLS